MEKREFTCISCPMGCRLTVYPNTEGEIIVEGYTCKRGLEYGKQELKDPRRNISSTVKIEDGMLAVLPVKTSVPIPKGKIFDVMQETSRKIIKAPIKVGDIIIENVLNTGSNIIASRSMEKISNA